VKVPIQFHYGETDGGIPLSAVEQVKARFAGRNNAEFHIYPGAGHGFNCWIVPRITRTRQHLRMGAP